MGSHNHQLVTCNPQGMLLEMLWRYVDVLQCPGVVFVCWKYCLLGGHQKLSRKITMFPSTGLKFILTMGYVTRPSKVFLSLLNKEPSGRFCRASFVYLSALLEMSERAIPQDRPDTCCKERPASQSTSLPRSPRFLRTSAARGFRQ